MLPGLENSFVLWLNILSIAAIAVFLSVALFLVLRQFVLWYFRLNQIADDMAELKTDLHVIATYYRGEMARIHLKPTTPQAPPAGHAPVSPSIRPLLTP